MSASVRAISSLGCPELGLDDTLRLAHAAGISAVELRTLERTTDLPGLFERQFGSPAALAGHVARQSVRIVALDTSLRLADPKPGDWEAFLAFVPWAEALGVRWLRVFDGGAPDLPAEPRWEAWRRWRELRAARDWQVDIMVETHDALFTGAAISGFLAGAPGAAILWDSHHTWKRGGEDPVKTWAEIKAGVVHVHVKDSVSRPSARHPFTYVLPGAGEFPQTPLRAVLEREFSGTVSLEWERQWHPYLPPLTEALAAAAANRWW